MILRAATIPNLYLERAATVEHAELSTVRGFMVYFLGIYNYTYGYLV